VLDELQGQPLMPEMSEVVERVKVNLRDKQKLELVYWSLTLRRVKWKHNDEAGIWTRSFLTYTVTT
jgi:hypothetical protein